MAKVLQNNYYTLKLTTDQVLELDGDVYTYKEASLNGDIITSGDCLAFQKILEFKGIKEHHVRLFAKVEGIRAKQREARKEGNKKAVDDYQKELDAILFIDDIISVKVKRKKDYSKIGRTGFTLNKKHYVRFAAGSGNLRRNTIMFINEELLDFVQEQLMCGLKGKIKTINLAKLGAYFALSMSSVLWVRTPRVCVVKDFYTTVKDQEVNYIDENDDIHKVFKDIKLNSADGQGLIDPGMAQHWAYGDMFLKYVPSSFVVRSAWVKGNLVPFNFRKYAREHNITTITDYWGQEHIVDQIDVILSESQFKMAKYYSSWEGYESFHNEYGLKWGVARYNKEQDAEYVKTNYQYLQVLDLDGTDITNLLTYTTDWIKNICSGNKFYTLAYSIGVSDENESREILLGKCSSLFTKAIMKNAKLLEDSYVQRKIYNSIKESIKEAKMGRVWVRGNYQFAISDPVAQCRAALGLSPDGLIPAHSVYCNFWNEHNVTGEIVCCRSPLTTYSEVVVNNLVNTDEMAKWYTHIKSGFIQSIYDINVMLEADGDYDGDILFSTNDQYFLKGVRRGELPIIYDKEMVPLQRITLPNQIKCDNRALDTIVGQITNYGTAMYAMLPMFKDADYAELDKRIKMTRKLQGEEIDKAKGTTPPNIPKEWLRQEKIVATDTDEMKTAKHKHNSLVINQKPYFFIYLYKGLYNDYKNYQKGFDMLAHKQYKQSLVTLEKSKNRTDGETNFLRRYRKYSPVIETPCIMNQVCRHIEQTDNKIKWDKENSKNILMEFVDFTNIDRSLVDKVYSFVKLYNSKKSIRGLQILTDYDGLNDEEVTEVLRSRLYTHKDVVREQIRDLFEDEKAMFNHIIFMTNTYNMSVDKVWELMGDYMIECIPWGETYILTRDEEGQEYLGQKLVLKEVD